MEEKTFSYNREGVIVLWQPAKCRHTGICVRGLPGVFDPARKPWIDMNQAALPLVIAQVKKCPSGALSIREEA